MPKYKMQLVKYTLPDAIKKYNDELKLKETKNKRTGLCEFFKAQACFHCIYLLNFKLYGVSF